MARTIAVASQKGGVGKTTTVASLGVALVELGQRVLLVDLDPQACLTFSLGIDPEALERSDHEVPTGEARITPGFRLPTKFVIHTVGPIYGMADGREAELLASCYRNSLDLAAKNGVRTIAFPSISTGVFGYPIELAAPIAVETVQRWLAEHPGTLDEVRFVLHSPEDYKIYEALIPTQP